MVRRSSPRAVRMHAPDVGLAAAVAVALGGEDDPFAVRRRSSRRSPAPVESGSRRRSPLPSALATNSIIFDGPIRFISMTSRAVRRGGAQHTVPRQWPLGRVECA